MRLALPRPLQRTLGAVAQMLHGHALEACGDVRTDLLVCSARLPLDTLASTVAVPLGASAEHVVRRVPHGRLEPRKRQVTRRLLPHGHAEGNRGRVTFGCEFFERRAAPAADWQPQKPRGFVEGLADSVVERRTQDGIVTDAVREEEHAVTTAHEQAHEREGHALGGRGRHRSVCSGRALGSSLPRLLPLCEPRHQRVRLHVVHVNDFEAVLPRNAVRLGDTHA
mmetsp:Transcript_2114/g.8408  ORF Transcript_2114/g.8408 Transcript_2114/m.8408 type:complete len:224 (-) Transcript_2114:418-1089(-)